MTMSPIIFATWNLIMFDWSSGEFFFHQFSVQNEFIRSLVLNITKKKKLDNFARLGKKKKIWPGLVFALCFFFFLI